MNDAQIRIDDCRQAVLNALHQRRQGAHSADAIRTVFLSRMDFTSDEVLTALADLERLHYVQSAHEGMTGSEVVWQISAEGLKFKEKGARK